MKRKRFLPLGLMLLVASMISQWSHAAIPAAMIQHSGGLDGSPAVEHRLHTAGNVGLSVTNWGFFGHGEYWSFWQPNCEFPKGSRIEHLYRGGLWIGTVVNQDTLVSVGVDGWFRVAEMFPKPAPEGLIERRSDDPADSDYSVLAVSEEEYISVFFDTLTDPAYVAEDPLNGRPHIPLGLQVNQVSYSWGDAKYQDFIICRNTLSNIGGDYLEGLIVGLFLDPDIYHKDSTDDGWQDDLAGLRQLTGGTPAENLIIAWSTDNDGDPVAGEWASTSTRHVFSVTLIDYPVTPNYGFNWWFSHFDPQYDWGPARQTVGPDSLSDVFGTPLHDADKYRLMTNGSIDFDQIQSGDSSLYEQWLPPSTMHWARNIADGYDARFLYSFGAVDLAPGDSLEFAYVFAMGENFHTDPTAFDSLFDYEDPSVFYEALDFSDLESNVLAAKTLYDSLKQQATAISDAPAAELPHAFELRQNYPNPFNRSTTIEFVLHRPSPVTLEVFNIVGQRVSTDELIGELGVNRVEWEAADSDGGELPSGVYFYRLATETAAMVKKMVFLK